MCVMDAPIVLTCTGGRRAETGTMRCDSIAHPPVETPCENPAARSTLVSHCSGARRTLDPRKAVDPLHGPLRNFKLAHGCKLIRPAPMGPTHSRDESLHSETQVPTITLSQYLKNRLPYFQARNIRLSGFTDRHPIICCASGVMLLTSTRGIIMYVLNYVSWQLLQKANTTRHGSATSLGAHHRHYLR
jgi:hypothetical protein